MPNTESDHGDWEEARRCYKCNQPGNEVANKPLPNMHQGRVITLECEMKLCPNFGERWIVQIKPDGTIPKRKAGGIKSFPDMTSSQIDYAKHDIAAAERILKRGSN